MTDGEQLVKQRTDDLHGVANSLHMKVYFSPGLVPPHDAAGPLPGGASGFGAAHDFVIRLVIRHLANRRGEEVDHLGLDIGYLKVSGFPTAFLMAEKCSKASHAVLPALIRMQNRLVAWLELSVDRTALIVGANHPLAGRATVGFGDVDMLTALSPHQLHYEIESGILVVLPFAMTGMQADIGITSRAGAQLPGAANALLDEIRRASAELIR